jgi:hypothetical protein
MQFVEVRMELVSLSHVAWVAGWFFVFFGLAKFNDFWRLIVKSDQKNFVDKILMFDQKVLTGKTKKKR